MGTNSVEGSIGISTNMGTVVFHSSGEFTFEAEMQDVKNGDNDNDGVLNPDDACAATPLGEVVNVEGCSIDDLCPCAQTVYGDKWKNRGAYVRCVAHTSKDFLSSGLITEIEKYTIVSEAGGSNCGHNK